jgi:hypothetical protein
MVLLGAGYLLIVRRRDISTFRLEKKTGTSVAVSKAGMMTEVRA